MKAFVIMFNRLTCAKKLCEDLTVSGCEVILIDNGSSYQPLLDWYKEGNYPVHYLKGGHKSLWESGLIEKYNESHYIVTDHDLDISKVPHDFVDFLMKGFDDPTIVKSGLSLKIDDLPKNDFTKGVINWEKNFWNKPRDKNGFYLAEIDTTLAIYDRDRLNINDFFRAVRSPPPYSARHLPWYNEENISEEEQYYFDHVDIYGYWTTQYIELFIKKKKNETTNL